MSRKITFDHIQNFTYIFFWHKSTFRVNFSNIVIKMILIGANPNSARNFNNLGI